MTQRDKAVTQMAYSGTGTTDVGPKVDIPSTSSSTPQGFASAGIPQNGVSIRRETYNFTFPGTPADLMKACRRRPK